MQLLDPKRHLTLLHDLVVELVPSRQGGELGTWEARDRVEE